MPRHEPSPEQSAEFPHWFFKPQVIAIEGLAATGKGATCRVFCERQNYDYVSVSSIGRGLAVGFLDTGRSVEDESAVRDFYGTADINVELAGMTNLIAVDGADVTPRLFDREVSLLASRLMRYDFVRNKVYEVSHSSKGVRPVIFDGRRADEIAPGADLQILLVASMEERVRRRYAEERLKDPTMTTDDIRQDMIARDRNELAAGAARATSVGYIVDTTDYRPEEVAASIITTHNRRCRAAYRWTAGRLPGSYDNR